jgi:hypothetical protein
VCSNIALPSIPNSPLLFITLDTKDRIFGAQELVTEHSSTKGIPKPPIRFTFYVVFAG